MLSLFLISLFAKINKTSLPNSTHNSNKMISSTTQPMHNQTETDMTAHRQVPLPLWRQTCQSCRFPQYWSALGCSSGDVFPLETNFSADCHTGHLLQQGKKGYPITTWEGTRSSFPETFRTNFLHDISELWGTAHNIDDNVWREHHDCIANWNTKFA